MQRLQYAVADIASSNPATRGQAMSNQFAAGSYPEQQDKRNSYIMSCTTSGVTPAELFIENIDQFRNVIPVGVVTLLDYILVGINGVPGATQISGRGVLSVINVAGALTVQGATFTAVSTAAATVAATVDNPSQTVRLTVTPPAATAGATRWTAHIRAVDVSDEG